MRNTRILFALLLFAVSARSLRAQVIGYEWVTQAGRNNLIDSNPTSCDPVLGCYNRTGSRCGLLPAQLCDLQVVPAGRCTYGDLSSSGGPGRTNTCVWPHGAGRCVGNTGVGCLTDAYVANPANTATGASALCTGTVTRPAT